jgi:steroid delta-isomerase-like uncharacterized protein
MATENPTKLNERFYEEVFRRRNVNAIDDLLTDDFVEHTPAPGQDTGRQGAKDFIGAMLQAFPDLDFQIEEQIAQGDTVATVSRMQGTHREDFMGIPATGKKVSVEVMDMGRVREGQFCDHWGLADMGGLMAQLGVAPVAR